MPCGKPSLRQFTLDGRQIEFDQHRTARRRKNLTIDIKDNRLRVLAPKRLSQRLIHQFIENRSDWILQRLDAEPPPRLRSELKTGGTLPLLGRKYPVLEGTVPFAFDGRQFTFDPGLPDRDAAAESWLREYARDHFSSRVQHWAPIVGVAPKRIQIRNQKTRWGSASSTGTLSFNWRLIFASAEIVDYIVVHELCHLIQPNHSGEFWQLVESQLPDCRRTRQSLHETSDQLTW